MNRYLINLSYIGTHFRGVQKISNPDSKFYGNNSTIQLAVEEALRKLRPLNRINVVLSSRTDQGVHALHSTVHVDLEKGSGEPYHTNRITSVLNRSFQKSFLPIRILSTEHVPNTFHCRFNAIGRTYIYRVAVPKAKLDPQASPAEKKLLTQFIPIEEADRCYFVPNFDFDIEKAKKAAKLFVGRHDFRTFMNTINRECKQLRAFHAVREINDIKIEVGQPMTTLPNYEKASTEFDYWNFHVSGKSFVYRQVRKMVATLLYVANGSVSHRDVYEMITIPSKHSWPSRVSVLPPNGLYLVEVDYDESSKMLTKTADDKSDITEDSISTHSILNKRE